MEYQWNINHIENMLEIGSPLGGGRERPLGRGAGGGFAADEPRVG